MSVIKELEAQQEGQQVTLVQGKSGRYYVVSSVNLMALSPLDSTSETMIFPANKDPDEKGSHIERFRDLWSRRPRDHGAGIEAAKKETDLIY